jgi:hypothetical protein
MDSNINKEEPQIDEERKENDIKKLITKGDTRVKTKVLMIII